MPRNVLISGGCGFVGSHLVDRLLRRDDLQKLVVVDNLWTGSRDNIAHVADPRLSLRIADAESFAADERFDEILHLASPASPVWYMREPARTIRANIGGALNLLSLLRPGGRFCFASTSEVYGDPMVSPQPESYRGAVDCTGPRSSYDESKRCTEALLFEEQRVSGLDVRVVRLFNTYGPRTRIDDGRAVSNFVSQALTTGVLTVYGDGSQSRSWGYVDDIVDGLERFFWRDGIEHKGPLNLGNNREISVVDIAKFVCSLVPGSRIEHYPPVPQDPTNRCPDLTLAKRLLPGWEATTGYEEGILRTFEWFRRQIAGGGKSAATS
ncbi:NAD-dependent epimerase/dehydratase family protein [Mesorhizobium comanense]|uniref:NAD-dependent epimerase/dehydratase family protein n=1 Tax=Mesorhizobium comanense TaxID=2502215 RepID=UPI0010F7B585|nr:NAD-dependent epimerase/dehydratase family protein [Mesorhizobium comanense]